MKVSTLLKLAKNEAEKSTYKQRMGAIIFDNNRILSRGYNVACRSVLHCNPIYRRFKTSLHAELAAVINAKRDISNCSIVVVRINKAGEFRLAKPCNHCVSYMNYVGIKEIYFSISEDPWFDTIRRTMYGEWR